jgi:hypothetical protein
MNTNPTRTRRDFSLFSIIAALSVAILSSCDPAKPTIESTPDDGKGVARIEVPNGTFSLEVVYPAKILAGELVTLKDDKGYTSNLRMVGNQFFEIKAEEDLSKGDRCKIVYYFKGWNEGRNRVCQRISASKIKPEVEANFGDTPAPTPPPQAQPPELNE